MVASKLVYFQISKGSNPTHSRISVPAGLMRFGQPNQLNQLIKVLATLGLLNVWMTFKRRHMSGTQNFSIEY